MREKKMRKKAYFFLMDGIFSIVILTIGFLIISSNKLQPGEELHLSIAAENTMNIFSSVRVNELCDESCNCSIRKLQDYCYRNIILNKEQTLLDTLGELYFRNRKDDAGMLFDNITSEGDLFRKDLFEMEFRINKEKIYPDEDLTQMKAESFELISSKKIIYGYYENALTGQVTFWGPYMAEVDVWRK